MFRILQMFSLSRLKPASNNSDPHQRSTHLRLLFLGPLVFTIIALVIIFIVLRYQHANDDIQTTVYRLESSAQSFYDSELRQEIHAMRGIIDVIKHREDLTAALAHRESAVLLVNVEKQFESLKRHFNISHFNFIGTDRVNLLRVHAPLQYGDTIERATLLQAESSASIANGIELGTLGALSLRVVAPWFDDQEKLIGYIELGMDIKHILNRLKDNQHVQLITVINKKYLNRDKWVNGRQALGYTHDWDHFQDIVINNYYAETTPKMLVEFLEREGSVADYVINEVTYKNREHRVVALPLLDAHGRKVAQMLMTTDVTLVESDAHDAVYTVGLTALALGGVLLIFFNWLIGGITRRLQFDEKELRELATRDGLTNLFNQRTFYTMLKDDIARACRYQRPVSLFLLDIDYFKAVNDNYGHLAGDEILRGLSQRLLSRLRDTDRVCRYGGEEFSMILPETGTDIAIDVAKSLCQLVAGKPFSITDGSDISLTVSIGVATSPQHAKDASQLVKAADTALYEAKGSGRNRVCVYS